MNKIGQSQDIGELIKFIFAMIIILPFLGAIFSLISSLNNPPQPACDYSSYQNALNKCNIQLTNVTRQINLTPQYIQNVTYIEVEKIVYKEKFVPLSINILALIFSLAITIRLFKINLPPDLEEKLKRIEKAIKFVKIGSLLVTLLIFIRLIFVFFSLF